MATDNVVLENRRVRLVLDAARNFCPTRVVDVRAPEDELFTLGSMRYRTKTDEAFTETSTSHFAVDDSHTFKLLGQDVTNEGGTHRVVVRTASPHINLIKEFSLNQSEPWVRARYTVQATGAALESTAMRLQVPAWSYGAGIENPLDVDIVDFSFGRIWPGGDEAPPFLTFWLKGRENGVIVWTRDRDAMKRVVPTDGALEGVHPTIHCGSAGLNNDDWTAEYYAEPQSWEFCLWPVRGAEWEAARQQLAAMRFRSWDAGAVDFPVAPGDGRTYFTAADIARLNPDAVSHTAQTGKWWLLTGQDGRSLLYAQDPLGTEPLTIPHDLHGNYRVWVAAQGGNGIMLRPHDARYPIPVSQVNIHDDTPFFNALLQPGEGIDLDGGLWRLDGGALEIGAYTSMYAQSVISHIALEPVAADALAARDQNLFIDGIADAPDIAFQDGRHNDLPYRGNVAEHANVGFKRVYWRADGQCCDFHTKVGTVRYTVRRTHSVFNPGTMPYGMALREYDLLTGAVEAGHESGIEVFGYMRINGFNGNVVPKFYLEHPELCDIRENGTVSPRMCFYLPEFRNWKVEIAREVVRHGVDGLLIDTVRTPQMVEYHPVVVDAYRAKFGKEPPRNLQRGYVSYGVHPLEDGPEWIEWWKFRADGFTQFGRDLRRMAAEEGKPNLPIHVQVRPQMALYDGFDLNAWADEQLVDSLLVWPSIDTNIVPQEIFDTARGRVPVRCTVTGHNSQQYADRMAEVLRDERFAGLTVYESNCVVWLPYLRSVLNGLLAQKS